MILEINIMDELSTIITNNVSAIAMALAFIWYLNKRDARFQETLDKLSGAIDDLREQMNRLKK